MCHHLVVSQWKCSPTWLWLHSSNRLGNGQLTKNAINKSHRTFRSSTDSLHSCSSSGVPWVWIPSSRAALGDWSVFVHWAQVFSFLRGAEGRWYSVPLSDLCPTGPHNPPAVSAGPRERPPCPTSPPRQRTNFPRLEGLQHSALKATTQQPGSVLQTPPLCHSFCRKY